MQENHLYEYAIVRIVPRVEREEFLNVGVVIYCKQQKFLKTVFSLNETRLLSIFPEADINEIKSHLDAFEQIAKGDKDAGAIGGLDLASRFRWLTAKRSTVLQTSAVHPGLCKNAEETLSQLLQKLVLVNGQL